MALIKSVCSGLLGQRLMNEFEIMVEMEREEWEVVHLR